eukprot:243151_1
MHEYKKTVQKLAVTTTVTSSIAPMAKTKNWSVNLPSHTPQNVNNVNLLSAAPTKQKNDDDEKITENVENKKEENKDRPNKKRQSISIDGSIDSLKSGYGIGFNEDDEWASDMDAVLDITKDLGSGFGTAAEEESDEEMLELNDYVNELNEFREKLEKEGEENEMLSSKIDSKNMELESCNNKIAELIEELNQNETDFYDSKTKIRHLQSILSQYQQQYPSYKPLVVQTRSNSNSKDIDIDNEFDDLEVIPVLDPSKRQLSLTRKDSVFVQNDLLQNLLSLHQRIETKMAQTELSLNEIRNNQTQQNLQMILNDNNIVYEDKEEEAAIPNIAVTTPDTIKINSPFSTQFEIEREGSNRLHPLTSSPVPALSNNENDDKLVLQNYGSTLIYESADEKLSEYDLDVTNGSTQNSEVLTNTTNSKLGVKENHITAGYSGKNYRSKSPSRSPAMSADDGSSVTKSKSRSKSDANFRLRQHLKNEKKLKKDLNNKIKEESKKNNSWCLCFGQKPKHDEGITSDLIEQYLKMQVRKELMKDKVARKKEKERTKALKKKK